MPRKFSNTEFDELKSAGIAAILGSACFEKNEQTIKSGKVARQGFEPWSQDPESRMIDRYTTGLRTAFSILAFYVLIYRWLIFKGARISDGFS